jgi:hypothetical protein
MRAQEQTLALWLRLLPRDEEGVLCVARRMIRRKIQRFEVVVIRFDDGAFGDRVSQLFEDADDFISRLDDGMLGADGTADAGERDVDALGGERIDAAADVRGFDQLGDAHLQFIDAHSGFALRIFGGALEPLVVDLREDAVFAGHPAIAKGFEIGVGADLGGFCGTRGDTLAGSLLEGGGRMVRQFGNGVRHFRDT